MKPLFNAASSFVLTYCIEEQRLNPPAKHYASDIIIVAAPTRMPRIDPDSFLPRKINPHDFVVYFEGTPEKDDRIRIIQEALRYAGAGIASFSSKI